MKIALGADHRGCEAAKRLVEHLTRGNHEVLIPRDLTGDSSDYPDYAASVAGAVARGEAERGILICGSGIGMCMAANKVRGVRAALVQDELSAEMSRAHNDANVLCVSADLLGERIIQRIADVWLRTAFEGGRHKRRVDKIMALETEQPG